MNCLQYIKELLRKWAVCEKSFTCYDVQLSDWLTDRCG